MKKLLTSFIYNHVFANLLLALIIIGGILSTTIMVREVFPSFAVETIYVRVPYPGAGPEEVEEGISLKIEDAIESVTGIKRYTTMSSEGMAVALIDVREGENVQVIKDRVTDKINAIQTFPEDAEKPTIQELEIRRDTMVLSLAGELPERQLKTLAEEVQDELLALSQVSDVTMHGTREDEISIEISEETLRRYGLTFERLSEIIRNSSLNLPGGELRAEEERIKIRTMGRNYTGREFSEIVLLTTPEGVSIRLGDIATIKDAFTEDQIITRFNGMPAVALTIYNSENEDALRIANQVYNYVETKNTELAQLGLADVQLHVWYNFSTFITQRISLLTNNGIIGLTLVFILLWFFLDLRLAFWVALGIPVSFAGAFILMLCLGESINMISLFAMIMVLGILVDDAIVVGEAVYYHRSLGKPPIQAAIDGTSEVALPVLAAVLTTCVAFIPLLFVKGIMGKFVAVIPTVVICALLVSLVESLFILPVHLNNLPDMNNPHDNSQRVRGKVKGLRERLSHFLQSLVDRQYRRFIQGALSWRYLSLSVLLAIVLFTVGLMKGGFIKFIFFPDIDTAFLSASVEFPEGTPLETTQEAVLKIESAITEVEKHYRERTGRDLVLAMESNIGLRIGEQAGNAATQASGSHLGEMRVELVDPEIRHWHFREIVKEWQKETGQIPGAVSLVLAGQSGGPPGKPIEVWLLGKDLDRIRAAAGELKEHLATYDGVFQIEDDFRPGKRELRLRLKPEARNLGITLGTLARQVRQGYYGDEVVRIQRGDEEVKVWVRYPEDERRSLYELKNIRIKTPQGEEVPLDLVADLALEPGYTTITRKDGRRRISVTADVFTETTNSREILDELSSDYFPQLMRDYPGVEVSIEGQNRETADSFSSLKFWFPMAILGIYLIIATIFKSYVQPLIIMITVPFGIIGAVWGHMLLGYDLTMMSMFGIVALSGVVVNDAIVMIEAINSRLAHGLSFADSIVDGGSRRFRAIMLTSATTIGGLAPLIMEPSFQAQFLIPMALTLASGVAFATVLTLVAVPCLLYILNDARRAWFRVVRGYWPTPEQVEPATTRHIAEKDESLAAAAQAMPPGAEQQPAGT